MCEISLSGSSPFDDRASLSHAVRLIFVMLLWMKDLEVVFLGCGSTHGLLSRAFSSEFGRDEVAPYSDDHDKDLAFVNGPIDFHFSVCVSNRRIIDAMCDV